MRKGLAAAISLLSLMLPGVAQAGFVIVGSVANWAAAPSQTVSLGDKNYVYLGATGWTGAEEVALFDNEAYQHHTLDIGRIYTIAGPRTMTLDYRIDVTSSNVLDHIKMDQNWASGSVTQTLRGYSSLADYTSNTPSFTLTANNGVIPDTLFFSPPLLQHMWFRNTISLNGVGPGQVTSVSSTIGQSVPEIDPATGAGALALLGGVVAMFEQRRRRRAG